MRRRYLLFLAILIFLYIGPVNLLPSYVPPAILEEPQDTKDFKILSTDVSDQMDDDGDDCWWWLDYNPLPPSWTLRDTDTTLECKNVSADFVYYAMFRFQIDVPQGATITQATLTAWETTDDGGTDATIWRINEVNVTDELEDDTTHPIWSNTTTASHTWDSTADEWHTDYITSLVQEQVNLGTWTQNNFMGFVYGYTASHTQNGKWEDQQAAGGHPSYVNITYTTGGGEEEELDWLSGSLYRQAHIIQQTTGADVNHTVPIEVYLGSGISSGNTTYLNNQALGFVGGLGDIRFTNSTNSELEYYLEEFYYGGSAVDYFTDEGTDFTWYSRNYPSTMYHKNRTYVSYMGAGYDPHITYYDHENDTWAPSYRVGTNPLVNDAHGSPAIYIDNQDYIHIIYGGHNTAFKHAKSNSPLSIRAWTQLNDIGSTGQSYASVAYDPVSNNAYVWYRYIAGGGNMHMGFRNSTDGGTTWGDNKDIVEAGTNAWPYKAAGGLDPNDANILHITFQAYNASESSYYQDVRYFYYNLTDTHCYNASGHDLGTAVDVTDSAEWAGVIAYDSGGNHVTDSVVKVDDNSYPYIVFATIVNGGRKTYLYYWSGSAWISSEICDSGNYNTATDFAIYSATNISAYVNKGDDITHYSWNGSTWTEEATVLAATSARGGRHLTYTSVPLTQTSGVGYFLGNDSLRVSLTEEDSGNVGTNVRGFSWGSGGFVQRTPISGAKFWVKVPANLSETDYSIYIYYGNSTQVTTSEFFTTLDSPVPNHGIWTEQETLFVTDTSVNSIDTFYETLEDDHMQYFDNETHGYYFAEDGVTVADWTYTDSAPSTDGDVMTLTVAGDDAFDYFVCNDTSSTGGYFYLEYYTRVSSVSGSPYYIVEAFEQDGAQGTSTTIATISPSTSWAHEKTPKAITHNVESIRIGARSPTTAVTFDIDWIRFTNETGWQHDGSTTWGVTVSGGGSVESDGNYLSLTSSGWSYFDFYLDNTATATVVDLSVYLFLELNFHPDDSDEWYYLVVYDQSGIHALRQTTNNYAIDYHWSLIGSDAADLVRIRISFSGTKTIRLDYMKVYSIANFTFNEYGRTVDGALYVESGNLVTSGNHSNYAILNLDPAINVNPALYSHIWINRTASQNVLFSYYQNAAWTSYDRHRLGALPTGLGSVTDLRFKISNAGTIYSIYFGNATITEEIGTVVLASAGSANGSSAGSYTDTHTLNGAGYEVWNNTSPYIAIMYLNFTLIGNSDQNLSINSYGFASPASTATAEVWNGSAWEIFATLGPFAYHWTNITDIPLSYRVDTTLMFRIYIDAGSSVSIDVDYIEVVWFPSSYTPSNDQAPNCTNVDDSTYMYSMYKEYIVTANVSDLDGYASIDYLEITLYDNARSTPYWTLRFDEDTSTFTEQSDSNNIITLNTGASSYSSSTYTLNVTFYITLHWNHSDVVDSDMRQYVIDAQTNSDTDWYEVDYDIESDVTTTFTLTDGSGTVDRGNINGIDTITASGTVTYQGSSLYPPSDTADVWINCTDVAGQPWSDTTLVSGAWSVTVDSDDVVGLDTYWAYVVEEGGGMTGTHINATSATDTYIADQIIVQGWHTDDDPDLRINVGASLNVTVWLQYVYDSTNVTDGTVTINTQTATYVGAGNWSYVRTETIVGQYSTSNVQCSGNAHGITAEDQNGFSVVCIWDRLLIDIQADNEDVGNDIEVSFTLTVTYDYDDTECTTYTIQIARNGTNWYVFTYSNRSLFNDTNSDAVYLYNATSSGANVSESTHGLTIFITNTETVTWAGGAPVNNETPAGSNFDDTDNLYAWYREYIILTNHSDENGFGDIHHVQFSLWDDTRATEYFRLDFNEDTATFSKIYEDITNMITLNITSCSNSSSGIYLNITWHIWVHWNFTPLAGDSDSRLYVNDTVGSTDIDWYETDWDPITLCQVSFSFLDDGIGTADRGTYGLTDSIWANGTFSYIWGAGSEGADNYPPADKVDLWIDSESCSYSPWAVTYYDDSTGAFSVLVDSGDSPKTSPDTDLYEVSAVEEGGAFGSDDFVYYGEDEYKPDVIEVTAFTQSLGRIDIDTSAAMAIELRYHYDSTYVTSGAFSCNGTSMSYNGVSLRWDLLPTNSTVTGINYSSVIGADANIGVNLVNMSGYYKFQIWDRLVISIQADDESPYNEQEVRFTLTVTYDYDDTTCTTYTIQIARNGTNWYVFTYANRSLFDDTNSDVLYRYNASSTGAGVWDSTYGLSAFTTNIESVIWSGTGQPDWHTLPTVWIWFYVPIDTWGLETGMIILGLIMIPASTMYLVRGGRKDMSQDKLFFFLVLFCIGWALVLGGIMP